MCATNAQPARARYAADVPYCMRTCAVPFLLHSCTKTLLASDRRTHLGKLSTTKELSSCHRWTSQALPTHTKDLKCGRAVCKMCRRT